MLTGFNTNIQHKGEVYHVQTEDGGTSSPAVTTQIFKAGAVFLSRKTSYEAFSLTSSPPSPDMIKNFMQEQHKNMIRLLVFENAEVSGKETQEIPPGKIAGKKESVQEVSEKQKDVKTACSIGIEKKTLDDLIDDYLSAK
ncbi:MAG: hypothetical protein ACE5FY_05400 [Nitrospiria bacterium]